MKTYRQIITAYIEQCTPPVTRQELYAHLDYWCLSDRHAPPDKTAKASAVSSLVALGVITLKRGRGRDRDVLALGVDKPERVRNETTLLYPISDKPEPVSMIINRAWRALA